MQQISLLIKPVSSLCNMRCKYCFYEDVSSLRSVKSYGRMSRETAQVIIQKAIDYADHVTFLFQGGEPTLAGLDFFEHFTAYVDEKIRESGRKIIVSYGLQTNGLMLDENWCKLLKKYHFLVGLSLDGTAEFHDQNRVDAEGKGTFSRVWHTKKLLEEFDVDYNIVWVLTNRHARFPQKIWNFLVKENIQFVQFIPCLGPLNGEKTPWQLTPERFSSFYSAMFESWSKDLLAGKYRSVKFFDDLFNLLLKGWVTACGFTGQCQMQFVVESDGSVYPCDFYVLDEWKCGSLLEDSIEELQHCIAANTFCCRDHQLPPKCLSCRWKRLCGGGCFRERSSMYLNQSATYCGYEDFLNRNEQKIDRVAQFLAAQR